MLEQRPLRNRTEADGHDGHDRPGHDHDPAEVHRDRGTAEADARRPERRRQAARTCSCTFPRSGTARPRSRSCSRSTGSGRRRRSSRAPTGSSRTATRTTSSSRTRRPAARSADLGAAWDLKGDSELAYVNALLAAIEQRACVDRSRIYATGLSYGGAMTDLLACDLAGIVRQGRAGVGVPAAAEVQSRAAGADDLVPRRRGPSASVRGRRATRSSARSRSGVPTGRSATAARASRRRHAVQADGRAAHVPGLPGAGRRSTACTTTGIRGPAIRSISTAPR